MSANRPRPWYEPSPAPHLMMKCEGQFDTHEDWINHASRALTGFKDSNGFEMKAICVDNLGRRCHNGGDFARARDEGAFPVRYFVEMEVVNPPPVTQMTGIDALVKEAIDAVWKCSLIIESSVRRGDGPMQYAEVLYALELVKEVRATMEGSSNG